MPEYKTTTLLRKKRLRRYWLIFLSVLFVLAISTGTYFWSDHEFFVVQEINVSGNRFVDSEFIKNVFDENTNGRHYFLASRRNFLFLPRATISAILENELPIERAYVRNTGLREIEIKIIEHEPAGLFCLDEIFDARADQAPGENCYYINNDGLVFAPSGEIVLEDLIVFREVPGSSDGPETASENLSTEQGVLGGFYSTPAVFKKFLQLENLLNRLNVSISYISTEDHETYNLRTKNGPYLLISHKNDPIEVVNNLKTTLDQESIHEIQFANIEYVDLRFTGKAYYKIK